MAAAYLPISTPTNDLYGGHRLGDNLFAESLVAVDCETGEKRSHSGRASRSETPSFPVLLSRLAAGSSKT